MNECQLYGMKFVGSIALGGLAYVGSSIASLIDQAPTWLEKYGFPTMACGLLCVGAFYLIKMLIALQNARLQDIKDYAARLEKFVEGGAAGRAELIEITREQLDVNKQQLAASAKSTISQEKVASHLTVLSNAIARCTGTPLPPAPTLVHHEQRNEHGLAD